MAIFQMTQCIKETISFRLMAEAASPLLHCRGKSQAGFEVRDSWIPGPSQPWPCSSSPRRDAACLGQCFAESWKHKALL